MGLMGPKHEMFSFFTDSPGPDPTPNGNLGHFAFPLDLSQRNIFNNSRLFIRGENSPAHIGSLDGKNGDRRLWDTGENYSKP